jgi:hypothetical protein
MPRFHSHTDVSAGPPPEVLAQIDAAWERAQELFTTDLELHFEVDRSWGQVWAELRNPDGTVAETLSASEAVALACGDFSAPLLLAA